MRGRGVALIAGASMGRRRGAEQARMQQQQAQLEQQQAPPAAAEGRDITTELQKLAQLHQSGHLSDQEFAAAKQKLLSQ